MDLARIRRKRVGRQIASLAMTTFSKPHYYANFVVEGATIPMHSEGEFLPLMIQRKGYSMLIDLSR